MAQQKGTAQKGTALQDPFLNILRRERIPTSIFLVNGIKLQGQIESFDQFVVLLRNSVNQMIYKHAISTIVPSRPVRIPHEGERSHDGERGQESRHESGQEYGNESGHESGEEYGNDPQHNREHKPSY